MRIKLPALLAAFAAGAAMLQPPAIAGQINTGGETGAYHSTFCPQLEGLLRKSKFDYSCAPSDGSRENIQRVIGDPAQVGFSQFDVYALEGNQLGGQELFQIVRSDVARECLFAVSNNPAITNYGEIAALASQLRFVLPPEKSGSTGTFEYLQQIDPEGLGLARDITYASSADDAINTALTEPDTVTLFVQFPDPKNARFKTIVEKGGNLVPVIDRRILRQEINGEKIYYAEETDITLPKWNKSAKSAITACTPMVIFTGLPARVEGAEARKDQEDLIRTVQAFKAEELQPKEGFLAKLWRRTKQISGKSVERMMDVSEKAREAAKPMMEKAVERAKEMTEKAKEGAKDIMEKIEDQSGTGTSTDSN